MKARVLVGMGVAGLAAHWGSACSPESGAADDGRGGTASAGHAGTALAETGGSAKSGGGAGSAGAQHSGNGGSAASGTQSGGRSATGGAGDEGVSGEVGGTGRGGTSVNQGGRGGADRRDGGAGTDRSSVGGASLHAGGSDAGKAAGQGGQNPGADAQPGCSGPIATFSGELATGITFLDDRGERVNAHGGGVIKEGDTYYLHGEYFSSTTTDNTFNGFSMYSSKDLATWKWEKMVLPQQADGLLGPDRIGERPHIIKCPSTGEFVLYAHGASSDYKTDREVVYATSPTVNGDYTFVGALTNASGTKAEHSDMSAFTDGNNAYVLTESGHVYTLATDCHSWVSDKAYSAVNGDSGGAESPTVFKADSTYYWIGSYKTGWRANNNFYSTAPAMTGSWTYQDFLAPVSDPENSTSDERTWLSQSTWVIPVTGCSGTVYVYWGDHWDGNQDAKAQGKHNYLATYVFQPLVFTGTKISLPTYLSTWKLDVGAGTWSQ